MKSKKLTGILLPLVCLVLTCFGTSRAMAADSAETPSAYVYEMSEDNQKYEFTGKVPVTTKTLPFGRKTLGTLKLYGENMERTTRGDTQAFGATDAITIAYSYDGAYQSKVKTEWNLTSDSTKTIDGHALGQKMEKGAILIQSSADGVNWKNACDPITDCFTKDKLENQVIYTASLEELKQGTYYRILVAYGMERRIQGLSFTDWNGEWERCRFAEEYKFYLSYEKAPLMICDVITRTELRSGETTANGFSIYKNDSTNKVTVSKDGASGTEVADKTTFTTAGTYTITTTSPLGRTFYSVIKIKDGMNFIDLQPDVYVNDGKKGYSMELNAMEGGKKEYGGYNYTSLYLAQNARTEFSITNRNMSSYGISGDRVSIFLRLNNDNLTGNGWTLSDDSYGEKEKQKIADISTGRVGTGALIVQTSSDGIKWSGVSSAKYVNGVYTTDFKENFDQYGDVLIYTPGGEAITRGVFIRVLYAFQAKDESGKNTRDYVEEYVFHLYNSNLDAITFHNLSVAEEVKKALSKEDKITMDMYKRAETMLDGAYTTSGFRIDRSLNPNVNVVVQKNGKDIEYPSNETFNQTGRYDITVRTGAGKQKTTTIYVDRMTEEDSLAYYFGNSCINGKRIFSAGDYPVFEAGKSKFHLEAVDSNHKGLDGVIRNITTGKEIPMTTDTVAKEVKLTEAGHYMAQFTTNDSYRGDLQSGDAKLFTFEFDLIEEGTAPGPVVNRISLNKYAHSTMTDSRPTYYGLTYSSAAAGNITRAYATRQDAFDAAYNYEKGIVEIQTDGTYRYTGSFIVRQKDKYESNWSLTEATNYFAEQAIQELYFDLSDTYTYTTLSEELINNTDNLRKLELSRSVFLFADGQKEALTNIDALPIINDKTALYLGEGRGNAPKAETVSFRFIADEYQCDSSLVKIYDANGKVYDMEYNESVGSQLAAAGCPSGIVTIHEENMYGDACEYQAVYIKENDNTAKLTLSYTVSGKEKTLEVSGDNDGEVVLEANAFTIAGAEDPLDPYGLIKVSDDSTIYPYCIHDGVADSWTEDGTYTITCVNRMGYSYSVKVRIDQGMADLTPNPADPTEDSEENPTEKGPSVEEPVSRQPVISLVEDRDPAEDARNQEKGNDWITALIFLILMGAAGCGAFLYTRNKQDSHEE